MPASRVRRRSSERIARGVLERLGYKILETNKKITVDEAEAFEVDILALNPKGEKYCVEVKACMQRGVRYFPTTLTFSAQTQGVTIRMIFLELFPSAETLFRTSKTLPVSIAALMG